MCNINAINIYITQYYFVAKWLTISSCFVVFGFQSLLRSPEVISFLQQQQRLLTTQNRAQTQHNYWRLKMFYSSCRRFNADTCSMTFLQQQYSILMWEPWASVTYSHPWWCGDYQHCILKTWDICQGSDQSEVLLSSSSSLRSWNELAAKSTIYQQSIWITTLFSHM